jgi:uncharacterized protein (TIGR03437 family)
VRHIVVLLAVAANMTAQSGFIGNAADFGVNQNVSYLGDYSNPRVIAAGSLATLQSYQQDSAPATPVVSIRPVGSSVSFPAQVTAFSQGYIRFVLPANTPLGDAQIIYKVGSGATNWTTVSVVSARFSLFRMGTPGPILAQQFAADGAVQLNGLATPVKNGQTIVLWGSGLGATPPSGIAVSLGGIPQTVLYAGASPSLPGVDQINFRIAPETPDGCYVPLKVSYGTQSVTSFLSKTADGAPCAHPYLLSVLDLKSLDKGGTVIVGELNLQSDLTVASASHAYRQESASVGLTTVDASGIAGLVVVPPVSPAACQLQSPPQSGLLSNIGLIGGALPLVNLGDKITLSSAASSISLVPLSGILIPIPSSSFLWQAYAAQIPLGADSPLASVAPPLLNGDMWTWTSSGGDVSPNPVTFTLPSPLQINGTAPLVLARDRDHTVMWNGSALGPNATVTLTFGGVSPSPFFSTAFLTCQAPARDGSITVPQNLLSQISPRTANLTAKVTQPPSRIPLALRAPSLLTSSPGFVLLSMPSSTDTRPVDIQ